MKMNKNNKKALSAGLAVAILVTGTFAWQSFNQYALNKTSGDALNVEPGGRLHDDFDGENKDIYIENYASVEDGVNVYARIRLDEYFEYGDDSDLDYGTAVGNRYDNVTVLRGDITNATTPVREDEGTWDTYEYGSEAVDGVESIRTYRDLSFGGSTTYMPTFNKNIWDTTADINGTYEAIDANGDRYADNDVWYMGDASELTEVVGPNSYDSDDDDYADDSKIEDAIHYAAKTETANVLSYDEWVALNSPVGDYWVYDSGWFYYATGISPQTASGLLLDNIQVMTDPDNNWFYGINVVAQIATAGDWTDAGFDDEDATDAGITTEAISANGLTILNKAAGITAVTNVSITKAGQVTLTNDDLALTVGQSLSLESVVTVFEGTGAAYETEVIWTIEVGTVGKSATEANACFNDGVFSPSADLAGGQYTIYATSKADTSQFDKITVTVN